MLYTGYTLLRITDLGSGADRETPDDRMIIRGFAVRSSGLKFGTFNSTCA